MKRKSEIEIGARMCAEIRRIFPDESLRGIARVLGCGKSAINSWENGSVPSAMFLARIHRLGGDGLLVDSGLSVGVVSTLSP